MLVSAESVSSNFGRALAAIDDLGNTGAIARARSNDTRPRELNIENLVEILSAENSNLGNHANFSDAHAPKLTTVLGILVQELMGVKRVQRRTEEKLEELRQAHAKTQGQLDQALQNGRRATCGTARDEDKPTNCELQSDNQNDPEQEAPVVSEQQECTPSYLNQEGPVVSAQESADVLDQWEQIMLERFQDPLGETLWSLSFVIGITHHGKFASDVSGVVLLLLYIGVIAVFVVTALSAFLDDDLDVAAAKQWRYNFGHWGLYASNRGQSMVDSLCQQDASMMLSTLQAQQYDSSFKYMHKQLGGVLRQGVVLGAWCILIFGLTVWAEMQATVRRVLTICRLPRARGTRFVVQDGGFVLCAMSPGRKVVNLVLCATRILLASLLAHVGTIWLVHTHDIENLVLNSVALVFILDIDELLYRVACPKSLTALIESTQPLPSPSMGSLHVPARTIITILVGSFWLVILRLVFMRPELEKLQDTLDAYCGGATNFVTDVHAPTGIVFSFRFKGSSGLTHRSTLPYRVTEGLASGRNLPDYVASESWDDFRTAIRASLADNVARYGFACKDSSTAMCVSTPKAECALNGALLAALGRAENVSNCSQLTIDDCMKDPPIIRLACPENCGCAYPLQGFYKMTGCPLDGCSIMERYEEALYTLPQIDVDRDVLAASLEWRMYWYSVQNRSGPDDELAVRLTALGWNTTAVVSKFMQLGCNAFTAFKNTSMHLWRALFPFFCSEVSNHLRRPLRPFCPATCGCANAGSTSKFCRRYKPTGSFLPASCPQIEVRGAALVHNAKCKQNLPNTSSAEGTYACYPNASNGRHLYNFTDSSGVIWELRWESYDDRSWGAMLLGEQMGLGSTSKWTLSSIDPRVSIVDLSLRPSVARFFSTSFTQFPEHSWHPRNSSNTDFDCATANGSITIRGATEVALGPGGSNDCNWDPRYVLLNSTACSFAAGYFGRTSHWVITEIWKPKGCFYWSADRDIYYNEHHLGRTGSTQAYPICGLASLLSPR